MRRVEKQRKKGDGDMKKMYEEKRYAAIKGGISRHMERDFFKKDEENHGAPERTRTSGLQIRNLKSYPARRPARKIPSIKDDFGISL